MKKEMVGDVPGSTLGMVAYLCRELWNRVIRNKKRDAFLSSHGGERGFAGPPVGFTHSHVGSASFHPGPVS